MAQDIKKLFEQERNKSKSTLSKGHEARFLQKLEEQFPQGKKRTRMLPWLRIAAASFVILVVSWLVYAVLQSPVVEKTNPLVVEDSTNVNVRPEPSKEKPLLTLSNISPDLKKVETYFISSINVELANLKVTEEEQEMVDAYMQKIEELSKEYEKLNLELNTIGINEMTITALIENLKIRLQLLQRLKKNLNHSKKETHEKDSSGTI